MDLQAAPSRSPLLRDENRFSAIEEGQPHYTTIEQSGLSARSKDGGHHCDDDLATFAWPHIVAELRGLVGLAVPVLVTTFLEFLPGVTSTILAGQMDSPLRKEYVDASTLSTMFNNITAYSMVIGISTALDTLCSQAFGAKRFDKIGIYFQTGLVVVGAMTGPIMLLNYYTGHFMRWLGQDPHVSELSQEFARYSLLGLPFIFLYELQRKVLQAQGIMIPLVVIALIGNLVHIGSGYALAYHTSLGFHGIAIGRTLGNVVLPLGMWLYFQVRPQHLRQWWMPWDFQAARGHLRVFLRLGIPGMLMLAMELWAWEILSVFAGLLPRSVLMVSAHSIQLNVATMVYMVFLGVSVATNVRVGNHLGANSPSRARLVSRLGLAVVGGLGLLMAVAMFVGRHSIPVAFVNDHETITEAAKAFLVYAPFEIPEALNSVLQGTFRGAAKQKTAAWVNAIAYYAIGLPLGYVLAFHANMHLQGLWIGFGLGVVISGVTLMWLCSRWNWPRLATEAQARSAD